MEKFDVVVVGAGTAGCITAKTIAKAGVRVCLVERKRKEDVGKKVCGDAIGKHHFENLGLEKPKGKELERKIIGIRVYSPNMKTWFDIKGEGLHGYIVNRHMFGKRLLKEALDAGAEFREQTQVLEPIIEHCFLSGVLARDMQSREKLKLFGNVVVDASGFSAVLRKKLPSSIGIDNEIDMRDVEVCYREIRQLKEEFQQELCEIYLNQTMAPKGYSWIFPESDAKVNVGLGVAMMHNFPNPRSQLYAHVLSMPLFKGSRVLEGGAWYVPTRRPLYCMVGNGVLVVGDSACQANPIHGGGIGPSMMGGVLAGRTIIDALIRGDVTREGLWAYNVEYIRSYGVKQATLDVFRSFLQACTDDELNYGMQYRLITEDDVLKASVSGEARLNITEKTLRVFRGLRKLGFLKKLRNAADLMREVKIHYLDYPVNPEGFERWKRRTEELFERVRLEFS